MSNMPPGLPGDSSGEDTDDEDDDGPYQGIPEVISKTVQFSVNVFFEQKCPGIVITAVLLVSLALSLFAFKNFKVMTDAHWQRLAALLFNCLFNCSLTVH